MDEGNYIAPNLEEGYSPEAIAKYGECSWRVYCFFNRDKARGC